MLNTFSVIGDPHITHKSLDKGYRLFQTIEELGNPVIILGDLLDNKEVIRGKCLNLWFNYLKSSKLQFVNLVGNHDFFNLEGLDHSLKPLTSIPNVRIIDSVVEHPTLPFVFFPYIHDKHKLKELVLKYASKDKVAFGHFDMLGFDFGNGHISEVGLSVEDFQGYKRVISGHYHKYQQTGNFTYLGTPFSHSFGEANQDKFLGLYTVDTDKLDLLPTTFPKHVSLKVDFSKRGVDKRVTEFIMENQGNIVRIQMHGPQEKIETFDKSRFSNLNIKWENKAEAEIDSKSNLDETLDNKTQFQEWAKTIKQLDNDTISLGLSVLEAVGAK